MEANSSSIHFFFWGGETSSESGCLGIIPKIWPNGIIFQWLFLVPLNDGRDYITHQKAIYRWYISGI